MCTICCFILQTVFFYLVLPSSSFSFSPSSSCLKIGSEDLDLLSSVRFTSWLQQTVLLLLSLELAIVERKKKYSKVVQKYKNIYVEIQSTQLQHITKIPSYLHSSKKETIFDVISLDPGTGTDCWRCIM